MPDLSTCSTALRLPSISGVGENESSAKLLLEKISSGSSACFAASRKFLDSYAKLTVPKAVSHAQQWVADEYSGPCPIRQLLDRIGDTWTVLVILKLGVQPLRFRQLLKAIDGISQRMLTGTLRALERDGLVLRTLFDTKPPSVEYRLTTTGLSLLDPITGLTHWALANEQKIARARADFERKVG